MSAIRTNAAAGLLGVSPSTLRSWERRYGFPRPDRSAGGHRQYSHEEIEALRQALRETQNISSAVAVAEARGSGPATPERLAGAYSDFDEDVANLALEESLALRSVERTIEQLLLPGLAELPESTPEHEYGWRHATGWLSAIKRIGPPASRPEGVLIADATAPFTGESLRAQALEVVLRRAGLRTLVLRPTVEPARLGRAVRALSPRAVVLAGSGASLDAIGRLVYAVHGQAGATSIFDFGGALPNTGASTVVRLPDSPVQARDELLGAIGDQLRPPVPLRRLA